MMQKIFAIRYRDAFYSDTRTPPPLQEYFALHVALGTATLNKDSILLSYVSEGKTVVRGLLLPLGSLVLESNPDYGQMTASLRIGMEVGVYWKDISHFDGEIPRRLPDMYTEGKIVRLCSDGVILSNPETLIKSKGAVRNHPSVRAKLYGIPYGMICSMTTYEG